MSALHSLTPHSEPRHLKLDKPSSDLQKHFCFNLTEDACGHWFHVTSILESTSAFQCAVFTSLFLCDGTRCSSEPLKPLLHILYPLYKVSQFGILIVRDFSHSVEPQMQLPLKIHTAFFFPSALFITVNYSRSIVSDSLTPCSIFSICARFRWR